MQRQTIRITGDHLKRARQSNYLSEEVVGVGEGGRETIEKRNAWEIEGERMEDNHGLLLPNLLPPLYAGYFVSQLRAGGLPAV